MSGMESIPVAGRRLQWLSGLIALLAVAAVAVGIRAIQGPQEASAQAPVKTPAGKSLTPLTKRPAAKTQQPAATTAKAPTSRTAAPAAVQPASAGQVMAVVNSEKISREELGHEALRRYGEEVLESLVNTELINDALKSRGIQISQKDIDGEIDRIAAKFGLPRDRWLSLLRDERGFTAEQYGRDVVWPMLALRKLAASDIKVTNEELQMAFESEYGAKVRARMIILPSQQKAQAVHAQAVADPRKFGQLARDGEDPNIAAASGVIPPIGRHSGSPEIEQAAFALKKGQVSKPIQVANKYVILYCEDLIPEQYPTTQQLPAIEKQLGDKLREEKIRKASSEFFTQMQQSAKIVDVWNKPELHKAHPGVAATINGRPITIAQLEAECVKRHGTDVLEGEINRKILSQELAKRKITVTNQDIDSEIARAAESYGKFQTDGKTPDVKAWLEEVTAHDGATVELYKDDAVWPSVALKKLVGNKVQVTEDDLQKGYESSYGERVEVLAIVLGDQRQAQRVWDQARNNPTQAYFEELAEQYSIEPTSRGNRGKVPPIRKHSGGGVLEDEAFKLKAGELSGILAVDDQFILMRCVGRTKPVEVDFASVKNNLYKDIHEKKIRVEMNKEFDRLLASAQVDNYLAGTSQAGRRPAAGPAATTAAVPAKGTPSKLTPIRTPAGGGAAPATATGPKTKTVR
jgi:parvulin-like peptidyl-prolyl isomerase